MSTQPKIIVALDFDSDSQALAFVDRVNPARCRLKVGKILFTRYGPAFVKELHARGFEVFLDLKFHDIPNTVAKACEAAADLGVWMVSVHSSGGAKMLKAASEILAPRTKRPILIGITILTHLTPEELPEIGLKEGLQEAVKRLVLLAYACGLDGVVCSPQENRLIRSWVPKPFYLVTPGIRPKKAGVKADDQSRVATPAEAVAAGSDYLVIGRPITGAQDPLRVLGEIEQELGG